MTDRADRASRASRASRTPQGLSRRTVLRAAGVAIGCPCWRRCCPAARGPGARRRPSASSRCSSPTAARCGRTGSSAAAGTDYTMGTAHASLEPLKRQAVDVQEPERRLRRRARSLARHRVVPHRRADQRHDHAAGRRLDRPGDRRHARSADTRSARCTSGPRPYAGGPAVGHRLAVGLQHVHLVVVADAPRTRRSRAPRSRSIRCSCRAAPIRRSPRSACGCARASSITPSIRSTRSTPRLGTDDAQKLDEYLTVGARGGVAAAERAARSRLRRRRDAARRRARVPRAHHRRCST